MSTTRHLDVHGLTDPGRVRESNEDHFLVAHLSKAMTVEESSLDLADGQSLASGRVGGLLLVADGVAGRASGGRASELAVEAVRHHVLHTMPWFFRVGVEEDRDRLADALRRALDASTKAVRAAAGRDAGCRGMATTLTMAYVLWPRAWIVHVGDSRCYHVRGPRIEAITRDHTVARSLADEGRMTLEEASRSRLDHVLWNAIGADVDEPEPDIHCLNLRVGDALILCTDGLTRHVPDDAILDVVRSGGGARPITERLVRNALDAGGEDNVTVVTALFPRDDGGSERLSPVDAAPTPSARPLPEAPPPTPRTPPAAPSDGPVAPASSELALR